MDGIFSIRNDIQNHQENSNSIVHLHLTQQSQLVPGTVPHSSSSGSTAELRIFVTYSRRMRKQNVAKQEGWCSMDIDLNKLGVFGMIKQAENSSGRSVFQLSKNGNTAKIGGKYRAWNLIGRWGRFGDTQAANNVTRTQFLEALAHTFGYRVEHDTRGRVVFSKEFLAKLEGQLGSALAVNDFGIDDKGYVTSGRPLTERRISAIVDAVHAKKNKELASDGKNPENASERMSARAAVVNFNDQTNVKRTAELNRFIGKFVIADFTAMKSVPNDPEALCSETEMRNEFLNRLFREVEINNFAEDLKDDCDEVRNLVNEIYNAQGAGQIFPLLERLNEIIKAYQDGQHIKIQLLDVSDLNYVTETLKNGIPDSYIE